MPKFQYKARNRMGGLVVGTMDASTAKDVGEELSKLGHYPVAVEAAAAEKKDKGSWDIQLPDRFNKITAQEIVLFSRQMATLFNAGIPILSILEALQDQMENLRFKNVILKIHQDVSDGKALSEAMARHPDVFTELYIAMIESGETGGMMDDILGRLADLLEKEEENDSKVKAAFRYPKIVLGVMVLAVAFLMWKVVPVFIGLFKSIKLELPLPTQILIGVHTFFVDYWYMIGISVVAVVFAFKRYVVTPQGRRQWDKFKLKVPLLGPIYLRSSMAKFARVFGNLQHSGVPIVEAIQVSSRVMDNVVLSEIIFGLTASIEEGRGISQPLKESGWIPSLVVQMVAAGESSGSLDVMLFKIADYYDQEVDRSIKSLSTWLEPILIVFMGVLVLFLALAIFLPMWDMSKMAGR